MSKSFWQIRKQTEQLRHGNTITSKAKSWIRMWEARCYGTGIPDTCPDKLLFSGRVPTYKALAMCILNNDHRLKKLGFSEGASEVCEILKAELKQAESNQRQLI